jgi:hypothetical protein
MSFAEIEAVLGRRLPPSARDSKIKRQWWANTDTHSQARAWLDAGRKARLDVASDTVNFITDGRAAGADKSTHVQICLDALTPAAQQLIRTRAHKSGEPETDVIADLLNAAARAHRRAILDKVPGRSRFSTVSSAELIREDRDGR